MSGQQLHYSLRRSPTTSHTWTSHVVSFSSSFLFSLYFSFSSSPSPAVCCFVFLIACQLSSAKADAIPLSLPTNTPSAFRTLSSSRIGKFLDGLLSFAPVAAVRDHRWEMVALLSCCTLFLGQRARRAKAVERERASSVISKQPDNIDAAQADLLTTDPGLLRKHSTFHTYVTSIATYPSIRTFYRPHPQADKLPEKPTPIPLLVFVHGLGGSLSQFAPILTSLVNAAPCLGIDLPGCGISRFAPHEWDAYSQGALVELLKLAIRQYCDVENGQPVILIAHSMGCSLATALASTTSPYHKDLGFEIAGLIAICPKISRPSPAQLKTFRRLLHIPTPIFDAWRRWDRRGGLDSASVERFLGKDADIETRKLQYKYNEQSKTPVWRRMAWGALPTLENDGRLTGGLVGPQVWAGLSIPIFAVAGEADHVTSAKELDLISEALRNGTIASDTDQSFPDDTLPQAAMEVPSDTASPVTKASLSSDETRTADSSTASTPQQFNNGRSRESAHNLKTAVLPKPASHAVLYDHATYRTLAGLIQSFLMDAIDPRLSLGWQLQHLCTEGKWDVKNLAKWQAVKPVSDPIANDFRAMKTLREVDDKHSPKMFVRDWSDKIKAVIDISHEAPVYDPKGLENGGIEYHKFPTVSKIPPTPSEVKDFIALVDHLQKARDSRIETNAQTSQDGMNSGSDTRLIGVHCHYGFNRTGFFICSYLIERKNFTVQAAIDTFQASRPPGIRHEHFLDTLFVRYHAGLGSN